MLLPFFVNTITYPDTRSDQTELVVLFHGIFTTSVRMSRLHYALHRAGYAVFSVTYPSRHISIAELAERIEPMLAGYRDHFRAVHIVGYSMGGLVARYYLTLPSALPAKRLVCIATPNQGTEYIDELRRTPFLKRAFAFLGGPSGNQLGSQSDGVSSFLPPVAPPGIETGIVAGVSRFSYGMKIPRPHDGCVSVERTHLAQETDHLVVSGPHVQLPFKSIVITQTLHFLTHGQFERV